ncbi:MULTISPECIES: hypothetical protein [unclassified Pseudomonas]|uniref:hypothetical protein n=1 Tax=unclassified Pseudomonas TaxID=196821 RepID=UPI001CBABC8E|nr:MULTISPECIES: hypothetical protein [unclassified Pseudomonas]
MGRFRCPICETDEAQELQVAHNGLGVGCAACSAYEITREAIEKMFSNGFRYNVSISRQWLQRERDAGNVPLITWQVAATLVAHPDAEIK